MKKSSAKFVSSVAVRLPLVMVIIFLGQVSSHAQDERNFWALNNTGKTISSLYVSPHEHKSWGKDILGQAELPTGIGTVISFDPDVETSCLMDFRLVFRDGTEQTYVQGRNVCKLGAVQFNRSTSIGLLLPD